MTCSDDRNTEPEAPQRDSAGRWLPGSPSPNPGGRPRNPHRLALERIAAEVDAETGQTAIAAILQRLADEARAGNERAAGLLLERLIPRAVEAPDERDEREIIMGAFAVLPGALRAALLVGLERPDRWLDTLADALNTDQRTRLADRLIGLLEGEEGDET